MTDVTDLGEIEVKGQRRRNRSDPFPMRPVEDGGGGPPPTSDPTAPLDPGTLDQDPCADPVKRRAWNADAAAAEAVRDMMSWAAGLGDGSTFANREFGVNLIVSLAGALSSPNVPVYMGDPAVTGTVPRVIIGVDGVTDENWMGDVHNHPSGDGRLSGGEWNAFINRVSVLGATTSRTDISSITTYVVVLDASAPAGYRIHGYTLDTPYDALGQEVNPDAQPCT